MKNIMSIICCIFIVGACTRSKPMENVIRVGTIDGPEAKLMEAAAAVAKRMYNLDVQIVRFADYNIPNIALHDKSIDANMFQHIPYLRAQEKIHGYKFSVVGRTFIYPMAVYSRKIKSIDAINDGAIIAIPNDPANEARALLLLEKAKLIGLKPNAGEFATLRDIVSNPKKLVFKELDAAQLPRVLPDVAASVINTNFAVPAGLLPQRDGIFVEDKNSPYVNIVVAREVDKDRDAIKNLVLALHAPEVVELANSLFQGYALRGW